MVDESNRCTAMTAATKTAVARPCRMKAHSDGLCRFHHPDRKLWEDEENRRRAAAWEAAVAAKKLADQQARQPEEATPAARVVLRHPPSEVDRMDELRRAIIDALDLRQDWPVLNNVPAGILALICRQQLRLTRKLEEDQASCQLVQAREAVSQWKTGVISATEAMIDLEKICSSSPV